MAVEQGADMFDLIEKYRNSPGDMKMLDRIKREEAKEKQEQRVEQKRLLEGVSGQARAVKKQELLHDATRDPFRQSVEQKIRHFEEEMKGDGDVSSDSDRFSSSGEDVPPQEMAEEDPGQDEMNQASELMFESPSIMMELTPVVEEDPLVVETAGGADGPEGEPLQGASALPRGGDDGFV